MHNYTLNLSSFLTECRNDILREAGEDDKYKNLKATRLELSERLQATAHEHRACLITLIDSLLGAGVMEINYYYLCGLRDGNKPDTDISCADIRELEAFTQYAELIQKVTENRARLMAVCPNECGRLFDEYAKTERAILDIEKTRCYYGGVRDKKRLDKQFDPSAVNEWQELMKAFL